MLSIRMFIFVISLSFLSSLHAITILYASALGCAATLPISDPSGTQVILDSNLLVSSACPLLLVDNAGDLTFTASGNQQLIIDQGAIWDISALQKPNALNFTGNAQLVLRPGAQLLADQATGVAINFTEQSVMSVQP